jgi:DNA-binding CsgD family transcriptional regulator/tetratricopeptide (TPR) repeat protein
MSGAVRWQPLVGRSAEIGRIRALTGPAVEGADRALVVLGEAGIGKSAVLADLTAHAGACGLRVLSATGREHESGLPFAVLRQLLRPVLAELRALPGTHAAELLAAVGMASAGAVPGRDLAGSALLGLLDLLARHAEPGRGLVTVIDDAQWIDRASHDVLAFAAYRLDARPVTMILAARGDAPPTGLEGGLPELRLGPLSASEASDLLDAQPCPPRGRARAQVLAQAAGNPLALIELTRTVTGDPAAERTWAGLPLPLTDRLSAMFTARLAELPALTRDALLLAAAADSTDRDAVTRSGPGLDPAVLAPAEEAGLVSVDTTGVHFRHPLIRSAVYHRAPFASRAVVHRRLADLLHDQPDRRAWHLAAAALRPDEDIASLLAATTVPAQRRDGPAARVLILERAARLSPDPAIRARRLLSAAEAAASTGQTEWARDLAARALALTGEEDLRSRCLHVTGWALAWGGYYASAVQTMLALAREHVAADSNAAWDTLGLAATAAYQAGDPDSVDGVADVMAALPPATDIEPQAARAWALAVTGRNLEAEALLRNTRLTVSTETGLHHAGAAAWLQDQTADAIRLLDAARNASADRALRAASGGSLAALGWAYFDAGRWDDALELIASTGNGAAGDITPAAGTLITATVEAARGNTDQARELVLNALSADPEQSRVITARARHALGLCALADDDYLTAFEQLRPLFGPDGTPYHPHVSYLAAGDLALAAARADCRQEGREIVKQIAELHATAASWPSARLRQLLTRADCVLADPFTPDAYPDDVLSDPAGERWPFERAQLRLEYGQWLRRHRRINHAKQVLSAAHDTFRALGSRPWAHRAATELRACGIAVPGAVASAAGLGALTPQQREIIGLAAVGLTNREIALRMHLSPRTVQSHLHRSFPKLGIAGRLQLHAVITPADPPGQTTTGSDSFRQLPRRVTASEQLGSRAGEPAAV